MTTDTIISRVWSFCTTLRDDGVGYGDYLEQLTYLIFLKMADEYGRPPYKRDVGVGIVKESVQSVNDFAVATPDGERPAIEVLQHGSQYQQTAADPEKAEYFVRVEWLETIPQSQAVNEVGLFGNQNTVCQPTAQKLRHTVDRLNTRFPKWNTQAGSLKS